MRTTAPEDLTPWCQLPDFRKELSREDPQHLFYNGGVASDVSASAIKMVIDAGKFGPPPVSAQIDAAYTAFVHDNANKDRHWPKPWNVNRIRYRLTSHPTFALGYKHGQVRDFLHFAHRLAFKHKECNASLQMAYVCVANLSNFVSCLDNCGPMLTEQERVTSLEMGQAFLDALQVLLQWDQGIAEFYWSARPQTHQFQCRVLGHLETSRMNPLVTWSCWMEETLMGASAKVTKRCHMKTQVLRALQRYALDLHTSFVV